MHPRGRDTENSGVDNSTLPSLKEKKKKKRNSGKEKSEKLPALVATINPQKRTLSPLFLFLSFFLAKLPDYSAIEQHAFITIKTIESERTHHWHRRTEDTSRKGLQNRRINPMYEGMKNGIISTCLEGLG